MFLTNKELVTAIKRVYNTSDTQQPSK